MKIEIIAEQDSVFKLIEDSDTTIEENSSNGLCEISEQPEEPAPNNPVNAAKPAPIENNAGSSWFAGTSWA